MIYVLLVLFLLISVKFSKRKVTPVIILSISLIIVLAFVFSEHNIFNFNLNEILNKQEENISTTETVDTKILDDEIDLVSEKSLEDLYVHFIDVGQADSIFIDYGDYEVLIDAGNNSDGELVVNYIDEYTDELDLVIASHPHEDHIGGLDIVFESMVVLEVIDSGVEMTTKTYKDYLNALNLEGAIYSEDEDRIIQVDENLIIEIIETGDNYDNTNDNSVVVKITFNEKVLLFTGDMEEHAEMKLLDKNIKADVLKAAHHGSKTSSSKEFLKEVDPDYIVISVGKNNRYGHPHDSTMERFKEYTNDIFITADEGSIVLFIGEIIERVYNQK